MAFRFPVKFKLNTTAIGPRDFVYDGIDLIECSHDEIIAIQERIAQYMIAVKPRTLRWDMNKFRGSWYESRVALGQGIQAYTGNYLAYTHGYYWANSENVTFGEHHALTYNTMNDHRLQAGAYTTSKTGYKNAANTPNTSVVAVGYKALRYIKSTRESSSVGRRPLYWNGTELQMMSDADIDDTFIKPALYRFTHTWTSPADNKVKASRYSWTPYSISTSSSLSGYSVLNMQRVKNLDGSDNYGSVITGPIFRDTTADLAKYTAGAIPETKDQSKVVRSYYIHKWFGSYKATVSLCSFDEDNNTLQQMDSEDITASFRNRTAYHSMNTNNYRIAFNNASYPPDTNSDSVNGYRSMGSVFDTRYTSSTYNKRKVNEDDYRTQEFPAASSSETRNKRPSADGGYTFYVIRY